MECKRIEVDNVMCLVNNLESERILNLKSESYSLTGITSEYDRNVFFRDTFDGRELVIRNTHDLSIIGNDNTEISIGYSYSCVTCFENVKNIKLKNIQYGHKPKMGSCTGSVLEFNGCENISLENLVLYGCGTYGIGMRCGKNVYIADCIIKECSYGILWLYDCENVTFDNCIFENNNAHSIRIGHSDNILFKGCTIRNNKSEDYEGSTLFTISDTCGKIIVDPNCEIDFDGNIFDIDKYGKIITKEW